MGCMPRAFWICAIAVLSGRALAQQAAPAAADAAAPATAPQEHKIGNALLPSDVTPEFLPSVDPRNPLGNVEVPKPKYAATTRSTSRPSAAEQAKALVPDRIAQARAEKTIRGLYREEYADTRPAAKRTLAIRLLRQAIATREDFAARWVLFREARDLAISGGYLDNALEAATQMAKHFKVEAIDMQLETFKKQTDAVNTPPGTAAVVRVAMRMCDDAMAADHFDLAARFAAAAEEISQKTKDPGYIATVRAYSQKVRQMHELAGEYAKAAETLKISPDDANANYVAGKYNCFIKSNWLIGMQQFKKGSDEELKRAAQKESANPNGASAFVEVADIWWQWGERHNELELAGARQRAAYWYTKALPQLSGLLRTIAEKRVAAQKVEPPALHPQVIRVVVRIDGKDQLQITGAEATWTHLSGTVVRNLSFAGITWDPVRDRTIENSGTSVYLTPGTDLSTAKLKQIRGRGTVTMEKLGEMLVVTIEDPETAGDVYEIEVTLD